MSPAGSDLVRRLGHGADARLLIVNCDDLGSTHAANVAIRDALDCGSATSASLMVPCPWAAEAAEMCRDFPVGVHLTLNAEYTSYRWGPMTKAPSLTDEDGALPRTIEYVWDHADLGEVHAELRMQISRALAWGVDVTHLDSHIGHMIQRREEFFEVYLDLAAEFRLPVRLTGEATRDFIGFDFRGRAEERGIVGTDELIYVTEGNGVGSRATFSKMLPRLAPGVNEMYVHPAVDTGELRAATPDWRSRVDDYLFTVEEKGSLAAAYADAGVTLISYRELRDLVRR